MARLSLDNFPKSSFKLTDGQKVLLVVLTLGFILLVGHLIAEANKARKIAQAKMAETQEKLKAAELERETKEKATVILAGQAMANAISQITVVAINEAKNQPPTDGSTPSV